MRKRLLHVQIVALGTLCLLACPGSWALSVQVGDPPRTINDGGPGDTDPAPGRIGFSEQFDGYKVSGTVIESTNADSASVTVTDLVVERTAGGPAGGIPVPMAVDSSAFGPIGPPAHGRATLNGNFSGQGPMAIDMSANTNVGPIGPTLSASPPPENFSEDTGWHELTGAVQQMELLFMFSITTVGDKITLPNSAVVRIAWQPGGVPAATELGLSVTVLLVLAAGAVLVQRRRTASTTV